MPSACACVLPRRLNQTPLHSSAVASLSDIVSYTDRFLRIRDVGDWDNALNGLQIENSGHVTRIGAAVDVSTRVLTAAQKRGVDFLIVHHGLFWPGLQPIQGALRRQLAVAFENSGVGHQHRHTLRA